MKKLIHPRNSVKHGSLHAAYGLYWKGDHLERVEPRIHRKKKERRRLKEKKI